ncbi:MAG: KTSC domain-containing protein [Candidatus Pacebacteria bacterium]|jgi:hypothetical protein|nr:KTSC domain-containing protein [Candidatus Paceibacterota bacterium]MBT4652488.1 KTSC domain-containing protein [Candidatus Paceibacterota bacterium]MBT6756315.1 KTSC domain-containing protein [Candidatus Paceibacterota bacterium]MBT6921606.1 KTSC domain-containing protein [Candidatus Paceibacterota bacterium]
MNKIVKKTIYFITLFSFVFFLSGCTNTSSLNSKKKISSYKSETSSKIVSIKYRKDPVNIGSSNFEYLSTNSSFVNGVWYDSKNRYMVILLKSTYYHYCGISSSSWSSFKKASSYGDYYNSRIKGNYDCRQGYVPSY